MTMTCSGRPPGSLTANRVLLPPISARRTLVISRTPATRSRQARIWTFVPLSGPLLSPILGVGVEPRDPALEARLGRRIARQHERVVPGHDVARRGREPLERLVAF